MTGAWVSPFEHRIDREAQVSDLLADVWLAGHDSLGTDHDLAIFCHHVAQKVRHIVVLTT